MNTCTHKASLGRSRKSPSTTNDSGRGSQAHLEDRVVEETIAIIERVDDEVEETVRPYRRIRTKSDSGSCPDLSSLRLSSSRAPLVESESDEEPTVFTEEINPHNNTIAAASCLLQRRFLQRAFESNNRLKQVHPMRTQLAMRNALDEENEEVPELRERLSDDGISRASVLSRRSNQTEDLADFDDNISTIILDHYLPLSRSSNINYDCDTLSSDFSLNLALHDTEELGHSNTDTASSTVQTDLSLINIEDEVAAYLTKLNEGRPISPEVRNKEWSKKEQCEKW
uniref:Uncharacterized protein n=1 Tax=Heterorhabditis bacteriophora TaxID=37862 RepID=A0A1I7XTV1_HETBA